MMIRYLLLFYTLMLVGSSFLQAQDESFYRYKNNQTHDYEQLISLYIQLAAQYPQANLYEIGGTDVGKPLHLFLINADSASVQQEGKLKYFINNGIHPGEPCGIDASLIFAKEILENKFPLGADEVVAIIPVYNVGGMLNRGAFSRANQNGPEEYGFRGNANNLDLNRDYIKMDSENAKSFAKAFHLVDPHFIMDTHSTNGADYQYNMTIIPVAKEQLHSPQADFFSENIIPQVYENMKAESEEICPYVYTKGKTPESGILSFYDSPRYTVGYASLFHCPGITAEAHMLKPYTHRVESTLTLLKEVFKILVNNKQELMNLREEARKAALISSHPVYLELDTSSFQEFSFQGYDYEYLPSKVTGKERLRYLSDSPKTFPVPYYNKLNVVHETPCAIQYLIPQSRREVIERLRLNRVNMVELVRDTVMEVSSYYMEREKSLSAPYEAHFYHTEISLEDTRLKQKFYAGDMLIYPDEYTARFLAHVLYPLAYDSYLRWNFFDDIFQQKEWFSPYLFEEKAEELLKTDSRLKEKFEKKREEDAAFREDAFQQLLFIYRNSPYYEKSHRLYPVFRLE
jgi:uncharacterized Zn-finger protein